MLEYVKLAQEHTDIIQQFQCSEQEVKYFLTKEALDLQEKNLTNTRLAFNSAGELVGYFTMYNDMMTIGKEKRKKHRIVLPSYKYYPCIKLHYLGVDLRFEKQGYGLEILIEVFNTAKEVSEKSGCVFLTVESLESAVGFYEKYQFEFLSRQKGLTNMFFKIKELY